MILLEKLKDEITLVPADREDVHPFILKHYLKSWPGGTKRIYGIQRAGRGLIGMIIYGSPLISATKSMGQEVNYNQVLELKRLFIEDNQSLPHIESYVIAQSLKMIKKEFPDVKVVITFADENVGHVGGIYQATNAIYLGKSKDGKHKYAYILRGNIDAIKNLFPVQSYPKK